MEMRYLSKSDNIKSDGFVIDKYIRLDTWKFVFQLFHKYNKIGFAGPFINAGYDKYVCESFVTDREKHNETKPDIFSWGSKSKKVLIVEITNNEFYEKKNKNMIKYKNTDPDLLSSFGVPYGCDKNIDVLLASDREQNESDWCQIILKEKLDVKYDENIIYDELRSSLIESIGINLTRLPDLSITLLPEMKKLEIRRGLEGYIHKIFEPNNEGYDADLLAEMGLDKFKYKFSKSSKKDLADKIDWQMKLLIQNYLSDYLEEVNGVYRAKLSKKGRPFAESSQSRKKISEGIEMWVNDKLPENDVQYDLSKFV